MNDAAANLAEGGWRDLDPDGSPVPGDERPPSGTGPIGESSKPEPSRGIIMKVLLIFIPLAMVFDRLGNVPASLTFLAAALAIVPMAAVLVAATEQISHHTSPTFGALLNGTFGNAPELIISVMALRAGLIDVVKASLVGVILGNLLFVLGLSFLLGGLRYRVQKYNRRGARIQRSVLMIAAISIVVPSVFDGFVPPNMTSQENGLNAGVAVILLVTYGLSLLYMLKTHPEYFAPKKPAELPDEPETTHWSLSRGVLTLVLSSVILSFMSEILVDAIEPMTASLGVSKAFIGVIVIALIGGAPESVAAVTMARKNKLDLTMGIAVGSSIQIALFVAPALMLSSYFIAPQPLNLIVGSAGIMIVLFPVMLLSMIVSDGRSDWFKGIQLLSVYALIALFCYYLPDSPTSLLFPM